jgi:hypothetical protein
MKANTLVRLSRTCYFLFCSHGTGSAEGTKEPGEGRECGGRDKGDRGKHRAEGDKDAEERGPTDPSEPEIKPRSIPRHKMR